MVYRFRFHYLIITAILLMTSNARASDIHDPTKAIPWPAELSSPLKPNATYYEVAKSNYLLDFHGNPNEPDLVIFMAGDQYRALPDLLSAFREWVRQQDLFKMIKLDNIFYATLPPGRLTEAMVSGQLIVGNMWFDVRPGRLWPDIFMTGPRQQRRLFEDGLIDSYYDLRAEPRHSASGRGREPEEHLFRERFIARRCARRDFLASTRIRIV